MLLFVAQVLFRLRRADPSILEATPQQWGPDIKQLFKSPLRNSFRVSSLSSVDSLKRLAHQLISEMENGNALGLRPRLVLRTLLKLRFYIHLADDRLKSVTQKRGTTPIPDSKVLILLFVTSALSRLRRADPSILETKVPKMGS